MTPEDAGAYALLMLCVTFVSAVGDVALRQSGPRLSRIQGGWRYLRLTSGVIAVAQVALVGAFSLTAIEMGWITERQGMLLAPLAVAVAPAALAVPGLVARQVAGDWHYISKLQAGAALVSLVVALPLIPKFGILACAVQSLVADGIIAWALRRSRHLEDSRSNKPLTKSYVIPTAVSGSLGWAQGQVEKASVAIFAGTAALGLFSIAYALGRTVLEAVAAGLVNVARARFALTDEPRLRRAELLRLVKYAILVGLVVQVVTLAIALPTLPRFFGAEWQPMFSLVPLLSGASVAVSCAWVLSAVIIDEARARRLVPYQFVGIALGFIAGATAAFSLSLAAALMVGKELLALGFRARIVAHLITRRTLLLLALGNAFSVAVGGVGFFLSGGRVS
ncbi:oligosaccharide flippase family protein [Demequina sp.]|uniref:oligosaccharide flippase family protein n=1 Tax=Demequina sp. TaxID=2050685 RepID=UPI003D0FBE19